MNLHPTSHILAAGTVGVSAGNAVAALVSEVPGSVWYSLGSGLIGLLTVWITSRKESAKSVVENEYLKQRIRDLEAEVRFYRPPPPAPGVTP